MLMLLGLTLLLGQVGGCKPDNPVGADMSVDTKPDLSMALSCEAMKCENPDAKCCNGEPCVDITISVQHCGGCNQPCHARENCSNGTCTCTGGGHSGACAASESCCSDGCHQTMTDVNNCGGCGLPCKTGEACNGGKCSCGGGSGCHSGQVCCGAGGCSDLLTDTKNCGMCGKTCAAGKACNNGVCDGECVACAMGEKCCQVPSGDGGVVGFCANTLTDANNCGMCGHKCPIPLCILGICAFTHPDGGAMDAGATDLSTPHD
jgi:hypothetical protein